MSTPRARGLKRRAGEPPRRRAVTTVLERFGLIVVLLVVVVVFSIALPSDYPTTVNLKIVLSGQATFLILALAVTLPLRVGEFDLSIGAVAVGAATVVATLTAQHGYALGPAIVVALAAGFAVGAVNAIVVVGFGVNAFIATLGSMTLVAGLALAISQGGQVIVGLPKALQSISSKTLLTLPLGVWYGWLLAIVLWYVYRFTPFGRRMLFIGGNPASARLAGIRVRRIKVAAFLLSGVISAAAGVVLAGSLSAVDPTTSSDYLLQPYAAAFLGTTVLEFGRFNSLGTVIGLYLLAAGVSGLELLGVQPWVSDVFNGGTLILAVVAATLMRRGMLSLAASRSDQGASDNGDGSQPELTSAEIARPG
jgi:ribose transport system permease protein